MESCREHYLCSTTVIRAYLHWATNEGCVARYAPGPMPDAPRPEELWAVELRAVLAEWDEEEDDE